MDPRGLRSTLALLVVLFLAAVVTTGIIGRANTDTGRTHNRSAIKTIVAGHPVLPAGAGGPASKPSRSLFVGHGAQPVAARLPQRAPMTAKSSAVAVSTIRPSTLRRPTVIPVPITKGTSPAVATMLYDATGYKPSQVVSKPVCGPAQPGYASCDSKVLVSRSTDQVVHPLVTGSGSQPPDTIPSAASLQAGDPTPYTPAYLQAAYDTSWLSATAGSGQTVAIVDAYNDPTAQTDLNTFRSTYGLAPISDSAAPISGSTCSAGTISTHNTGAPCMVELNQSGQASPLPATDSDWRSEESLDLDAVSAMCPNCNILFIEASSASDADLAAADAEALTLGAKLISNSFGGPSPGDGDYYTATENQTGHQAGSETFASTGDDGAYVDGVYPGQTDPTQAPYPASEPGITAVGGTSLDPAAGARGIDELAWSGAGSACSTFDNQPSWQANVDTGCSGRASSDVSADADPNTGLRVDDNNSWGYYGGTSLASPLTAAYVALTAVNSGSAPNPGGGSLSAQWAYGDASQLNDITGGSNGTCPANTSYAPFQTCNGGPGWDGPTGIGSISGDVVSGGPSLTVPPEGGSDLSGVGYSIVQAISTTSATFDGGAYPNGSATTVWWEWGTQTATSNGTNFSSASQTTRESLSSTTQPALATATSVAGLTAGTTYAVEECASNGSGTVCGNVTQFKTPTSTSVQPDNSNDGPIATDAGPLTSGAYTVGDTLSTSTGVWQNGASATFTYEWWEGADATAVNNIGTAMGSTCTSDCPVQIGGATSRNYQLQPSDAGKYVFALVLANGYYWPTPSLGPVAALAVPGAGRTSQITDTGLGLGGSLSQLNAPTFSPGATSMSYQWQESAGGASGWSNVGGSGSSPMSYPIALADSKRYIRLAVTGTNAAGSSTAPDYSNVLQVNDLSPTSAGNVSLSTTGLGLGGVISIANSPSWSPGSPTVADQWQESSTGSGGWGNIGGATATSYTIQQSDSQLYIRAAVTATDPAGTTTAYSNAVQVDNLGPSSSGASAGNRADAQIITAPKLGGRPRVGATIAVSGGSYMNAGAMTVTFQRCGRGCRTVQSDATTTYLLRPADAGYYITATVTIAGIGGGASASTSASRLIGPIISPLAGVLRITAANATLESGSHVALLKVQRSIVRSKSKSSKSAIYELRLQRAHVKGPLHAWACVWRGKTVPTCTASVSVARKASFSVIVPAGNSVELIAVR